MLEMGFDVYLLASMPKPPIKQSLANVIFIRRYKNRLFRFLLAWIEITRIVLRKRIAICHLHDPELIPLGFLLKLLGRTVIYDIHEDYLTAIQHKRYLPAGLRSLIRSLFAMLEWIAYQAFHTIIAEKYYARRFPKSLGIYNYPLVSSDSIPISFASDSSALLYTGNITVDRGAQQHVALLRHQQGVSVSVVGLCSTALAEQLVDNLSEEQRNRLELVGVGHYVDSATIDSFYQRKWLAGLALFPPSPHYSEKELTKFFEYMKFGLPIIASDFPAWKALIEVNQLGFCVNPDDQEAISAAIAWLQKNPKEALQMAQNGQRLVQSTFNWAQEAEKLKAFYTELVQ